MVFVEKLTQTQLITTKSVGIERHEYTPVVNALRKNPQAWLDFMTIAISYVLVGIALHVHIPRDIEAMAGSVVLTLAALLIFSYAKGYFTGT
jgi:hypothetical protein